MRAVLIGLGWAGLGLAAAARLRAHLPEPPPRPAAEGGGVRPPMLALEKLGQLVLRALRRPPPSPPRARAVGAAACASVAALLVDPWLAPVPALLAAVVPPAAARRRARRRVNQIEAELAGTIDLLLLAVGAGCNVSLAVAATGRRGQGLLAAELRRVTEEVAWGRRLADALDDLPDRTGEATRPLVAALVACERYGSPLGPALEGLAADVRHQRRRRAEEAARRVSVVLLFPLVVCILPAFALLTVAPMIAGALGSLGL